MPDKTSFISSDLITATNVGQIINLRRSRIFFRNGEVDIFQDTCNVKGLTVLVNPRRIDKPDS